MKIVRKTWCPKCHKSNLISFERIPLLGEKKVVGIIYNCFNCDHTESIKISIERWDLFSTEKLDSLPLI